MDIPDLVNAGFELCATLFILNNSRVAFKQKMVAGVSIISIMFFTSWGFWNIYYYPHLGQALSFYCGIGVVIANMIWVSILLYYRNNPLQSSLT